MMKCPHCDRQLRPTPMPRIEKAARLAKLLGKEFKKRGTATKDCPAKDIAQIAIICIEKGLSSPNTARADRIFSLFKHLHAYAEDLKPYGPNSRRAGYYRVWMNDKYGVGGATALINKSERMYKELKHGTN